jgi:nitrite reductase/ring-hydroxylating ferredoxin subunit
MKKMFMKKIVLLLIFSVFLSGCDNESFNNFNPNIPNYTFTVDINTDLPLYGSLKFPGNGVYISQGNAGVRGIIVFSIGGGGYNAFDAACPNQALSSCSTMIVQGSNALCPCDEELYNLFTGLGGEGLEFPMKRYRVEVNGPIVRVYN